MVKKKLDRKPSCIILSSKTRQGLKYRSAKEGKSVSSIVERASKEYLRRRKPR